MTSSFHPSRPGGWWPHLVCCVRGESHQGEINLLQVLITLSHPFQGVKKQKSVELRIDQHPLHIVSINFRCNYNGFFMRGSDMPHLLLREEDDHPFLFSRALPRLRSSWNLRSIDLPGSASLSSSGEATTYRIEGSLLTSRTLMILLWQHIHFPSRAPTPILARHIIF